ncbi:MAG: dihydroorotase [Cytophagaceae bacterium]|nr:dihydroorotase [Cytophagaceae bacterium]MDW8456687.1 dihydroorotase [Cytophagaceae bacterium]
MKKILIRNSTIVNEGSQFAADVLISNGRIEKINSSISNVQADLEIEASGKHLLPGVIDDQVHFREPGLTHKADIYTESRAAVAGGITSYMEMPNTVPQTLTQQLLEEKYAIAAQKSLANYSFFMGVSNHNYDEVMKTNPVNVCGIKIFMGSSTGDMLVDNPETLEKIFSSTPMLIATHCEDENTIRQNLQKAKEQYGTDIPPSAHPIIRNEEACYLSSSYAVQLAKKHKSRLHVLHISTQDELSLFTNDIPLKEKHITSEVCIHHLWFDSNDYEILGNRIKWNPSVKAPHHKKALFEALLNDRLDIIATDHAPHTLEEKNRPYTEAPSGGPMVQHSLLCMLEFYHQKKIRLEKIVEKMCHAPSDCFRIAERGYIREGYWADLVLVDLNGSHTVSKNNLLYKCKWSPLEGYTFHSRITHTFVSGHLAYAEGRFDDSYLGKRLLFTRH